MTETESDEVGYLPVAEVSRRLVAALGPTLVASLAGVKDRRAPRGWAEADVTPRPRAVVRLRFAQEQWHKVAAVESEQVARLWFVGANPWLRDNTPITAIREGRFDEVATAVQALLDNSFDC